MTLQSAAATAASFGIDMRDEDIADLLEGIGISSNAAGMPMHHHHDINVDVADVALMYRKLDGLVDTMNDGASELTEAHSLLRHQADEAAKRAYSILEQNVGLLDPAQVARASVGGGAGNSGVTEQQISGTHFDRHALSKLSAFQADQEALQLKQIIITLQTILGRSADACGRASDLYADALHRLDAPDSEEDEEDDMAFLMSNAHSRNSRGGDASSDGQGGRSSLDRFPTGGNAAGAGAVVMFTEAPQQ